MIANRLKGMVSGIPGKNFYIVSVLLTVDFVGMVFATYLAYDQGSLSRMFFFGILCIPNFICAMEFHRLGREADRNYYGA